MNMARKTALLTMAYLAGLLAASFLSLSLAAVVGIVGSSAAIVIMTAFRPQKNGDMFRRLATVIAFSVGMLLYCGYDAAVRRGAESHAGEIYTGEAVVENAFHYSGGVSSYILKLKLPDGKSGRAVMNSYEDDGFIRGDRLTLSGRFSLPDDKGFFDEKSYYSSQGVFLRLDDTVINDISVSDSNVFEYTESFRRKCSERIRSMAGGIITEDSTELVIGMLFGRHFWKISDHGEDMLFRSGIGHIASVSGMHMAIIAGMTAAVLSALNAPRWLRFLLTILSAAVFALTADLTVSVIRSLVMIILVYSAELFNRRSDPLTSLGLAAVVLTIGSPFCVRNVSFLLSVSGVMGAGVIAPYVIERTEDRMNAKDRGEYHVNPFLAAVISSFCASAAVFPAAMLSFDEVSMLSPVVNLVLSPLFPIAAGGAAAGAAALAIGLTPLAVLLFGSSALVSRIILFASELAGSVQSALIPTGTELTAPMVMITLTACVLCMVLLKNRVYAAVTLAVGMLMSGIAVKAYVNADRGYTSLALLSEGKGCVMVIDDGKDSFIIDMTGSSAGVKAARSYIRRNGCSVLSQILVIDGNGKTETMYAAKFPEVPIISADKEIGLTYGDKDNIIFNGCAAEIHDGCVMMNISGADITAVNRKCVLPARECTLGIMNCRWDAPLEADMYAVTRTSFMGEIPEDRCVSYGECSEYIISDGRIMVKEDKTWLR